MIYYRCDLCGCEQEQQRGADPLHPFPIRLSDDLIGPFPDVKDICVDCNDAILAVTKKAWDKAAIAVRIAAIEEVTRLQAETGQIVPATVGLTGVSYGL